MGKFDFNRLLSDLGVKPEQLASPDSTPAPASSGPAPASGSPTVPGSAAPAPSTGSSGESFFQPIPGLESASTQPPRQPPAPMAGPGMTPINFDTPPQPDNTSTPPGSAPQGLRRKHSLDSAEEAFTHIPAVPAGQRSFTEKVEVKDDPAVPVAPKQTTSKVGQTLNSIYQPDDDQNSASRPDLGKLLVATEVCTPAQLSSAEQVVKTTPGKRLPDVLIEQGCDEIKVQSCVADWQALAFERINVEKGVDGGFDAALVQRLTLEFCKAKLVLPLRYDGQVCVLGVVRPEDVFLLDEVRRRLLINHVRCVVITALDLRAAVEVMTGSNEEASKDVDVNAILSEVSENDVQLEKKTDTENNLEEEGNESPVIRYVNYIIQTASREGASDIHVEPGDKKMKVRFRIDGEMYEMMNPPVSLGPAIISRLKIMANLDISERRLPQDGRIRCMIAGRKLDLRVSTLPTGYGEKVVMRILDTKSINVTLDQLGFDADTYTIWRAQIDAPHGIVLVTGPTGSGKTTTLYASLKQLDKNAMNISTVEDPVEYHLEGITQCQTHEKIGMTFAKALKALLRQDPDVILLGEIRDLETAVTAVQAALTGHLVLSTLHTNDAPSAVTRLVNIGIETFLVGAALNAVLAQRLVRKICSNCKHEIPPNESMVEFLTMNGLSADKIWAGKGCEKCRNTGYSGRVGLYELLVIDDQLRDVIARNPNVSELRRICTERGMVNLRIDGLRKAVAGRTSVEEVLRITESTI